MEKPHVLLVDDNDATRTLVTALLQRDFNVDAAADGEEAIEKLRTSRYSAVLLDLRMPTLDGFEVLEFLKEQNPDMLRRVLIVTAALTRPEISRATEYGICGVVRKPFEIETLLEEVRRCAAPGDAQPLGGIVSSGMILMLAHILRNPLM